MARVIAFVLLAIFATGALCSSSSSSSSEERRPRHRHHHHNHKPHCPRGEEWIVGATITDATCTTPGVPITPAANRCSCKAPLIRGPNDRCIKREKCPSPCPNPNEIWVVGSGRADGTCANGNGAYLAVPVNACRCKSGFVRDADNKCVCRCNCPRPCGPFEQQLPAAAVTTTEPTCATITTTAATYTTPQCRCIAGYIRNQAGNCVLPSQCTGTICTGANTELTLNAPTLHDACGANFHNVYPATPVIGCRCQNGFIATANSYTPPAVLACIAIPNPCV